MPTTAAPSPMAGTSTGVVGGMPPQEMKLNPAYSHDKLATASLILGIVSLPAAILNILTLPIPLTGLVLGIVSLKQKKSFALAGIILSVIGLILSAVVLIVGLHIEHNKNKSSSNYGVQGSLLSSSCYKFNLPSNFSSKDVLKNTDCTSELLNSGRTEDLLVNSTSLSADISQADQDSYLSHVMDEFASSLGSKGQITNKKFITLDGGRAYEATGSESYANYKYLGAIVALSPKAYFANDGTKLQLFIMAFDSASKPNVLDSLVQSWQWQ